MYAKSEKFFKNNVSLINSKLHSSESVGVIAVFTHGASRIIYLEEGSEKKCFTKYSMMFTNESIASYWMKSEQKDGDLQEWIKDIKLLKKESQMRKIIQINQHELSIVKEKMDDYCTMTLLTFDGEQDADISNVMKAINKKWELNEKGCCTIF